MNRIVIKLVIFTTYDFVHLNIFKFRALEDQHLHGDVFYKKKTVDVYKSTIIFDKFIRDLL